MKKAKVKYAQSFTVVELREHYRALIGEPKSLTRKQLIKALKGTEFDEFAYDL